MRKAQINKTVLIALIGVVAVLILVWFFWGQQLIGQAIGYQNFSKVGSAGITVDAVVDTQTNLTLHVKANLGTGNASGAAFNLTLPEEISCTQINVTNLMKIGAIEDLTILDNLTCSPQSKVLSFIYFALDNNSEAIHTGPTDIADIFIQDGFFYSGNYLFNLTYMEIINYSNYVNLVNTSLMESLNLPVRGEDKGAILISLLSKENGNPIEDNLYSKEHTIQAKITPRVNLSEHLVLVTVNVEGKQTAQFTQKLPSIKANNSETVAFDYTFPESGEVVIKAMVWNNSLQEGKFWDELIPFATKKYSPE